MSSESIIAYRIESEAQRARRQLAEAQARLDAAREAYRVEQQVARSQGVSLPNLSDWRAESEGQADAESARIERLATAAKVQSAQAIQERTKALSERTIAAVLSTLATTQSVDLTAEARRIEAPKIVRLALEVPELLDRARRIMGRLEVPEADLQRDLRDVLQAPVDTATLRLAGLSARVDDTNRAARKRRADEAALAEAQASAKAAAAGAASDAEYVLGSLVDALEQLGYQVGGTLLTDPATLVLDSPGQPGFAVTANTQPSGELKVSQIRVTGEATATTEAGAEAQFCSALPELRAGLAARGVEVTRMRTIPQGVVGLQQEGVERSRLARQRARRRAGLNARWRSL